MKVEVKCDSRTALFGLAVFAAMIAGSVVLGYSVHHLVDCVGRLVTGGC